MHFPLRGLESNNDHHSSVTRIQYSNTFDDAVIQVDGQKLGLGKDGQILIFLHRSIYS